MHYSKGEDQYLANIIAGILSHAGLVPAKKAPSLAFFQGLASAIIQQQYRSIIREIISRSILENFKIKIHRYDIRLGAAMLSIDSAMVVHGRHLEAAPPKIEEEPTIEGQPKNRSVKIIESIKILRKGGVTL